MAPGNKAPYTHKLTIIPNGTMTCYPITPWEQTKSFWMQAKDLTLVHPWATGIYQEVEAKRIAERFVFRTQIKETSKIIIAVTTEMSPQNPLMFTRLLEGDPTLPKRHFWTTLYSYNKQLQQFKLQHAKTINRGKQGQVSIMDTICSVLFNYPIAGE